VTTTAIVLAAGASSRLGRPKQLLTVDGETLVARAIRIAREACDRVVLVIPPTLEVAARDGGSGVLPDVTLAVIVNDHAEEGIASSIRLGVEACDGDILLLLCDQPRIAAGHLRGLVESGAPIAATAYAGILGVPAFFAKEYRNELLELRGDAGARRVIEANRDRVTAVPFEEAAIDIDTEADVQNL
jgi:molybdenum cofactor cytidylyltransferase